MNAQELTALLERLRREPHETEWLEFKESDYEPQVLGEYLSALANAACLAGKPQGYLVFGIQDQTHAVAGTRFDPYAVKAKGNQDLLLWLAMGLQPNVGFEVHILDHPKGKVVFFEVGPAWEKIRIPFSQMMIARGWIKEGAASMYGATPGDQVMRLERVEGFQVGNLEALDAGFGAEGVEAVAGFAEQRAAHGQGGALEQVVSLIADGG